MNSFFGGIILIIGIGLFIKSILIMYKNKRHHSGEGKMMAQAEYQKLLRMNPDGVSNSGSEQEFILEYMKKNKPSLGLAIIFFIVSFVLIMRGAWAMIFN